ncbi:hypothetical protein [Nonomuraea sp. NPDC049758]|uniref:hypothetical protein n=1 Tax=Nonomuraea sp. NPDC049758 TaxID=3154360 RepID=UPI003443B4CE
MSKDPVQALKAVLTAGHGMRFTETSTLSGGASRVSRWAGRSTHAGWSPDGRLDTRYSRWGGKVSIKAPDPRETTSELCIEGNCHWRLPG